jgi:hypothetical protein
MLEIGSETKETVHRENARAAREVEEKRDREMAKEDDGILQELGDDLYTRGAA